MISVLRKRLLIVYFIAFNSTKLGRDEIKSTGNRPIDLRKGGLSDMVGRWNWH